MSKVRSNSGNVYVNCTNQKMFMKERAERVPLGKIPQVDTVGAGPLPVDSVPVASRACVALNPSAACVHH